MEDQFGGRTDDDLFYDDFEPVNSETIAVHESKPAQSPAEATADASVPLTNPPGSSHLRAPKPKKLSHSVHSSANHGSGLAASQPQPPVKGGNLSSSRFARKGHFNKKQQSVPSSPAASQSPAPSNEARHKPKDRVNEANMKDGASPPPNAPTAPAKERKSHGSQNSAVDLEARLGSGANPRQKLTEAELALKMEKMKLLSAEKARKFEKAEKDEKQHAEAYAKGMEEARKRRAEEAERRRRGAEDQRILDEERAKNRERKLKAMGIKEGGWDDGKDAILEEEARRGFRGANGGIRGTKRSGFGGSRFAREGEEQLDVDRFLDERHHGRGRGRGGQGGGRGRGGRGGFAGPPSRSTSSNSPALALTADEFPALPSDGSKKATTTPPLPVYPPPKTDTVPIPLSSNTPPPGSKWDDEMEALDELKKQGQLKS